MNGLMGHFLKDLSAQGWCLRQAQVLWRVVDKGVLFSIGIMTKGVPFVVLGFLTNARSDWIFVDVEGGIPEIIAVFDDRSLGAFPKDSPASFHLLVDKGTQDTEDLLHEFRQQGGGSSVKHNVYMVVHEGVVVDFDGELGFVCLKEEIKEMFGFFIE